MVSSVLFVALLLLSVGSAFGNRRLTQDGNLPTSFAYITDANGNACGGAFLDAGFVVTSTSCAATLDIATSTIITAGNTINVAAVTADMNGLTLLQLRCPGVTDDLLSSGTISFASLASEALEAGSCFPTGTLDGTTGNGFVGINTDGAGNINFVSLTFVPNGQCQAISNIGNVDNQNCFQFSGDMMILSGSPAYINDSNSRETIIGIANSNLNNTAFPNVEAYLRVSNRRTSLGNFIFDASTGNQRSEDQITRRERQDMLRQRIQAGESTSSGMSSGMTSAQIATLNGRISRAIKVEQKRSLFLNQVREWHVQEDGLTSSFTVAGLQDKIDSHFAKRAPASAFVCPVVIPGCLP